MHLSVWKFFRFSVQKRKWPNIFSWNTRRENADGIDGTAG
jgi:hypothetical protein